MPEKKNVLVIYTDQQRADSLGCMGNALARTPNLDALAGRGVLYRRHYAANPVCMPSRASFHTGRYPQAHGVIDNGIFLPPDQITLAEAFRRGGYRTASFGKLHFQTYSPHEGDTSMESMGRWGRGELDDWTGPYYGFEKVALTLGHGEQTCGHYGRWRGREFPGLKLGPENATSPEKYPSLACYKSNLPLEAHHSTWVTDRAVEYLQNCGGQPFFLHISFPDPHHPFTPPSPYSTMFDNAAFPPPHAVAGENDAKPAPWRRGMSGNPFPDDGGARYLPEFTGQAYQQVLAHTHGMVALLDDCVGRLLATLQARGLADNTLIVFAADHGDLLGDHHFLFKGQIPCRSLLNVPLIIADPGGHPGAGAGVSDAVCSNVDVMPTLLTLCGLDVPPTVQGVMLPAPDGEKAGHQESRKAGNKKSAVNPRANRGGRDYAFAAGQSKASPEYHHYTIYTDQWRITVYPVLREGELYDLQADPWEHVNLFDVPAYAKKRDELLRELLYAVGKAEPARLPVVAPW